MSRLYYIGAGFALMLFAGFNLFFQSICCNMGNKLTGIDYFAELFRRMSNPLNRAGTIVLSVLLVIGQTVVLDGLLSKKDAGKYSPVLVCVFVFAVIISLML